MFAANIIARSAPVAGRLVMQKRTSVISGAPRNKIPFVEKAILGGIMITGICFGPAWVLVNIRSYQEKE